MVSVGQKSGVACPDLLAQGVSQGCNQDVSQTGVISRLNWWGSRVGVGLWSSSLIWLFIGFSFSQDVSQSFCN